MDKHLKTGGLHNAARSALWSGKLNPDDLPQALSRLVGKVVIPVVDKRTGKEHRRRHPEDGGPALHTVFPDDIVDLKTDIVTTGDKLFVRFSELPEDLEFDAVAARKRSRIAYETTKEMLTGAHISFCEQPAQLLQVDVASFRQAILAGTETVVGKHMKRLHAARERAASDIEFNPS